ncbi:unnamed protein product [Menidia menidia]|uniref:Calnexin n=1 Tax=Menidia menidia TaxID=238744 RepID=A0A8S4BQ54_9TELE|nr:unnamed protein product [Menidia menidia]
MHQRVVLFVLMAAGLLCLAMATVRAEAPEEEGLGDELDVEDELDLGLAGAEDEDEEDLEPEEAPSAPKAPAVPKVRGRPGNQDLPVTYKAPEPMGEHFFAESFDRGTLDGWVLSKAKKDDADEEIAKYDGQWAVEEMKDSKLPGDKGLVLKSRAKHHAISAQLLRPFTFDTMPLIVQYEVNFQTGIDCGGAYVKLLTQTPDLDLDQFVDKTPYTIMFGPDKCGEDYKLHFIFRHKNPKTGEVGLEASGGGLKLTHLPPPPPTVVNSDNTFEVLVDQTLVNSGSLLTDMTPPVNPPAEIEDPDDQKPDDWDERPKIQDPDAVKPEDWDEDAPAQIPDEVAVKPDGWLDDEPEYIGDPEAGKPGGGGGGGEGGVRGQAGNRSEISLILADGVPRNRDEDMDGEWEAPQIPNPACESAPGCGAWQRPMVDNPSYKGKWKSPMIDNPSYQGIWKPRKIPNPAYFEDLQPYKMAAFSAVGLELWSMSSDIFFDNFFISNDRNTAERWAADGWGLKKAAEGAAEPGLATQMLNAAEERPWLWVVYVLTVALPLILIFVFCCTGKKKTSTPAAQYKKTDEPQPDVKEEEEEKEEEKEGEEEEKEEKSPAECELPFNSVWFIYVAQTAGIRGREGELFRGGGVHQEMEG